MTPTITDIKSRLIYNSRGSETIEVDIFISDIIGTASSPAGASVGKFEAVAFRNANCKDTVDYLNKYKTKLIGIDASDIYAVKDILRDIDGTENKSLLGANSVLAVSLAVARAAAKSEGKRSSCSRVSASCTLKRPPG